MGEVFVADRDVAEGVAPADRAPGSGVGAAEREGVRPLQAERGEGRVGGGARTRQRRSPALLAEAIGREAHIGKIGEGLEGDELPARMPSPSSPNTCAVPSLVLRVRLSAKPGKITRRLVEEDHAASRPRRCGRRDRPTACRHQRPTWWLRLTRRGAAAQPEVGVAVAGQQTQQPQFEGLSVKTTRKTSQVERLRGGVAVALELRKQELKPCPEQGGVQFGGGDRLRSAMVIGHCRGG